MNFFAHRYLIAGLEAGPIVMALEFKQIPKTQWDKRSDPERFTIREVMAHLADMEEIWLGRVNGILNTEGFAIPNANPDEFAARNNYAAQDPLKNLKRYETTRAQFLAVLKKLQPEQWANAGVHSEYGKMTIRDLAQGVLGHDSYHVRQLAELNATQR